MKYLAYLLFLILFGACKFSKEKEEVHDISSHSQIIKTAIVQACLDTITKDPLQSSYDIYKFILIKNDKYTLGLDSLHFWKNKIHLSDLPKGVDVYKHDPNKDDNNTVYMDIKYELKTNDTVEVFIQIYYYNEDWTFTVQKEGGNWKIIKMRHGIS